MCESILSNLIWKELNTKGISRITIALAKEQRTDWRGSSIERNSNDYLCRRMPRLQKNAFRAYALQLEKLGTESHAVMFTKRKQAVATAILKPNRNVGIIQVRLLIFLLDAQ